MMTRCGELSDLKLMYHNSVCITDHVQESTTLMNVLQYLHNKCIYLLTAMYNNVSV